MRRNPASLTGEAACCAAGPAVSSFCKGFPVALPRQSQPVIGFQIGPRLRVAAQHFAEGDCRVRRDGLFAVDDFIDRLRRAVQAGRQFPLGNAERLDLLGQRLARRYGQIRKCAMPAGRHNDC